MESQITVTHSPPAKNKKKKTKKMKSMAPSVQNKTQRRQSRPPSQLWRRRLPLRHVSGAALQGDLLVRRPHRQERYQGLARGLPGRQRPHEGTRSTGALM
ncbi:hypothetical protein RHGRI_028724 [Rhododendron griersonianum]|uniref:Uncharacterized protein n=1 Tax=Rhododendron griersonianum TaxID=479676 RepID=A0AAV6IKM8_9ERIC|nr:hypothetical protein RHGRI_028724 [Rhododendron griersonianum]